MGLWEGHAIYDLFAPSKQTVIYWQMSNKSEPSTVAWVSSIGNIVRWLNWWQYGKLFVLIINSVNAMNWVSKRYHRDEIHSNGYVNAEIIEKLETFFDCCFLTYPFVQRSKISLTLQPLFKWVGHLQQFWSWTFRIIDILHEGNSVHSLNFCMFLCESALCQISFMPNPQKTEDREDREDRKYK